MRFRNELTEPALPASVRKFEADAALAAVEAGEVAVADLAGDVSARRLDLGDLGAEVGEHHRGVRTGQHVADLEDADALERTVSHRTALASSPIISLVRYLDAIELVAGVTDR